MLKLSKFWTPLGLTCSPILGLELNLSLRLILTCKNFPKKFISVIMSWCKDKWKWWASWKHWKGKEELVIYSSKATVQQRDTLQKESTNKGLFIPTKWSKHPFPNPYSGTWGGSLVSIIQWVPCPWRVSM